MAATLLSVSSLGAQSPAAVARVATPATATILTYDAAGDLIGQGSGFVLRDDGMIVTNYHVMEGAARAEVRFPSGAAFTRVSALAADADHDLALLDIGGRPPAVLAAASRKPAAGDEVIVIGTPRGLDFTVTTGIVSALRKVRGQEWIQISAPISPGSSGGPVLDRDGRVIGVTTAYRTDGQALNFAVPIGYVMDLASEARETRSIASAFPTIGSEGKSGTRASRSGGGLTLTGTVTNLGTIQELGEERTGKLSLTATAATPEVARMQIGPPLAGSGDAAIHCWSDSVLITSIGEEGDTIAWIGRRGSSSIVGEYLVVGGDFRKQGGIWRLESSSDADPALSRLCRAAPRPSTVRSLTVATRPFRFGRARDAVEAPSEPKPGQPTPEEAESIAASSTRLAREAIHTLDERGLLPDLLRHMKDAGLTDPGETKAEVARMTTDGGLRLAPDRQFERLRFWGTYLLKLDAATCGRWTELDLAYRGPYLISRMNEAELREFVGWQVEGLEAELNGRRKAMTQSESRMKGSLSRIAHNLGDDEGDRFLEYLSAYDSLTPASRCWVELAMIRGILAEESKRRNELAVSYWLMTAAVARQD